MSEYKIITAEDSSVFKSNKYSLVKGKAVYTEEKRVNFSKNLSYYCGLEIFEAYSERDKNISELFDIMLIVNPQFGDNFDIIKTLLTALEKALESDKKLYKELINKEEPYKYILNENNENNESLVVYDNDTDRKIDIGNFTERDKKALEEIRDIYDKAKAVCTDLPGMDNNIIFPFVVNMSLLLELAARAVVFAAIKDTEWRMQEYVQDKHKSEEAKDGTRNVLCKDSKDNFIYHIKGKIIPDIVLEKVKNGKKNYIILDAKYKKVQTASKRDDRLQILAYAYLYDAHIVGHIFPEAEYKNTLLNTLMTAGADKYHYVQLGFKTPSSKQDVNSEEIISKIREVIQNNE
ncbi:MAG: hypothetical protein ACI4F2_10200 [Acutalibacteraceae bacterium]